MKRTYPNDLDMLAIYAGELGGEYAGRELAMASDMIATFNLERVVIDAESIIMVANNGGIVYIGSREPLLVQSNDDPLALI